jgi:hypothetical protein
MIRQSTPRSNRTRLPRRLSAEVPISYPSSIGWWRAIAGFEGLRDLIIASPKPLFANNSASRRDYGLKADEVLMTVQSFAIADFRYRIWATGESFTKDYSDAPSTFPVTGSIRCVRVQIGQEKGS